MGMIGGLPAGRAIEALAQASTLMAGLASRVGAPESVIVTSDRASGPSPYDRLIDGLNRLPRPFLTLGTFGLFGYAMADPAGFGARMEGLALVPEPLWWLFGAVVSFHFGSREAHYIRRRRRPKRDDPQEPTPAQG